jgi:hypothetical protein
MLESVAAVLVSCLLQPQPAVPPAPAERDELARLERVWMPRS